MALLTLLRCRLLEGHIKANNIILRVPYDRKRGLLFKSYINHFRQKEGFLF